MPCCNGLSRNEVKQTTDGATASYAVPTLRLVTLPESVVGPNPAPAGWIVYQFRVTTSADAPTWSFLIHGIREPCWIDRSKAVSVQLPADGRLQLQRICRCG